MKNILLAVILLISLDSVAQNTIGLPQVINYTKTDYHGGSQTWDIKQDSSGRMYFANNEGLLTYDGTYWRVFPLPNRTIARSLELDHEGRIYVGGQGEMGYFMNDKRGFLQFHSIVEILPEAQRIFADIWDVELHAGSVFFRASDRIFELSNNSIKTYPASSEWILLKKVGNKLFAQDKEQGLFQFSNRQWLPAGNNQLLKGKSILGMIAPSEDTVLLATYEHGFLLYSSNTIQSYPLITKEKVNSEVYAATRLNRSEFVLGTTSAGCIVLDFKGNIIQRISQKEGLQNNSVLCVFLDRDRNLWTGLNNGISFIAYNAAIKYIRPEKENELSGFSARILRDKLYIGSSDGAFQVPLSMNQKDLSFSRGQFELIRNSEGQVWKLEEVNQEILMAHNSGTYVIEQGLARKISPQSSWIFVPTSQVIPSKNILVGTYTGLMMLGYDGNFKDLGNLEGTYESFRFLDIDNDGRIWSSHPYRGIYELQLSADKKKYLARLYTDKDGLPSSLGNHVFRIKNRVVFATEKGAYEYDRKTKRFVPSPFLSPILGDISIRYLNEDAEGNIWFCSGKKLGVARKKDPDSDKEYSLTYFPELTGQVLSGFENVYPYNANNIFIASENGIIHLNLDKYALTTLKLMPQLGEIRAIGRKDSTIFGGYVNYPLAPGEDQKSILVRLPNSFSSFHFEYSCPAYGLQNNIEYSYKLEGFDREWSAWSNRTEKNYTNLSDGEYTFMVKARSNLSSESEPVSYTFYVLPPWYKTRWAYIGYALLLLGLVYLFDKWQKRKLTMQRLEYEEKQRQINIAHQLEIEKNEKEIIKLQNEKLASEMVFKNKELADTSLHLVERTQALSKVKEELQKLYRENKDQYSIKRTIQFLNDIEKNNDDWDKFATHFDEVNNNFLRKLKSAYPQLSSTDLKICAYLQLNLSSKEIAQLINISLRGVEIRRYRLRKKLQVPGDKTLLDFLSQVEK